LIFPNCGPLQVRCTMEPWRGACAPAVSGVETTGLPVAWQKMNQEQSYTIT